MELKAQQEGEANPGGVVRGWAKWNIIPEAVIRIKSEILSVAAEYYYYYYFD